MMSKFKFITGAFIFCGGASKVAINNWTSIYSAFSAYLWGFMIRGQSTAAHAARRGAVVDEK